MNFPSYCYLAQDKWMLGLLLRATKFTWNSLLKYLDNVICSGTFGKFKFLQGWVEVNLGVGKASVGSSEVDTVVSELACGKSMFLAREMSKYGRNLSHWQLDI